MIVTTLRAALAAGVLLMGSAAAIAGDAEVAYLHSLAGDWVGSGRVVGPEGGDVSCRLVLKPAGTRLNFNGRCSMTGAGAQSFSGSIRYSDQRRRFESSSGTSTVAGNVKGSTLTFVTAQKTIQGDISSTMTLSPRALKVQFRVVEAKSGAAHEGSIPFSKS